MERDEASKAVAGQRRRRRGKDPERENLMGSYHSDHEWIASGKDRRRSRVCGKFLCSWKVLCFGDEIGNWSPPVFLDSFLVILASALAALTLFFFLFF